MLVDRHLPGRMGRGFQRLWRMEREIRDLSRRDAGSVCYSEEIHRTQAIRRLASIENSQLASQMCSVVSVIYLRGLIPDRGVASLRHGAHFGEWPLTEATSHTDDVDGSSKAQCNGKPAWAR